MVNRGTYTRSIRARNELPLRLTRRLRALLLGTCGIALAGSLSPATADDMRPGTGDEFLVVDCLLPGQVRQLGRRVTYVSKRRPVLATARECGIRGGEFVLEDRASISGSIQAWLPAAMDGDAEAQNYVGELLERGGEGDEPDYAMARLWFERAADQGSNEAQFNLARLYEKGLGGPEDPDKAAELYRAAYGFDGELATQVRLVDPQEVAALKSQIVERDQTILVREAEIAGLQTRVSTLEAESADARAQIADLERQLADRRAELSTQLRDDADAVAGLTAEAAALEATRADLVVREQALQSRADAIAAQEQALVVQVQSQSATGSQAVEIARLTSALETARTSLSALTTKHAQAVAARDRARQETTKLRNDLDRALRQVSDREAALAERERFLASQSAGASEASSGLKAQRAEIDQERQSLAVERARISAEAAAYEGRLSELTALRRAVEEDRQRLTTQRASLEAQQRDLDAQAQAFASLQAEREALNAERAAFERDRSGVSAAQAAFTNQAQNLERREMDLSRRLTELEARSTSVSLREAELDKREREAATAQQSAQAALSQLTALKEQIEATQATLTGGQRSLAGAQDRIVAAPVRQSFEVEFGTYHALLIGNQNYEDPNWPDLDTSHNDVNAIGAILKDKYGFETVILRDANRYEILKAISDLGDRLGPSDNLLIYFAGHGQYIDKISSGYWEPVDSVPYKTVNSISVQDVNAQLSLTDARKVLVVSDSCYSGAFTRAPFAMLDEGAAHNTREKYLQQIADKRSRNVMTAGGLQPVADGLGNGHSLFARAFISALVDNDEVALGRDLFSRVRDVVTVSATQMNWEQEPEYDEIVHSGHEGGDFIFVPTTG